MGKNYEAGSDLNPETKGEVGNSDTRQDFGGDLANDEGVDLNAGTVGVMNSEATSLNKGSSVAKAREYDSDPVHQPNRIPTDRTGRFGGERGNSSFYPNNDAALTRMQGFGEGINSIEYRDGNPDFSPFSNHNSPWGNIDSRVEIGHMTDQRTNPSYEYGRRNDSHDPNADLGNYAQGDNALADRLRESNPDITSAHIEEFRTNNGLTWHEYPDGKSMQLVPTEIHDACRHSGGVSDMRERMAYGDVDARYRGLETDTSDALNNPMYDDPKFDQAAYEAAINENETKNQAKPTEHSENMNSNFDLNSDSYEDNTIYGTKGDDNNVEIGENLNGDQPTDYSPEDKAAFDEAGDLDDESTNSERTEEAEPERPEEEPEQPEAEPEQQEIKTEQSETEPEQPETEPEQPEAEPEQPETEPEQPESETEQSETEAEQQESEPEQQEEYPEQLEAEPEQPETEPEQPETETEQPEAEPEQTEAEPEQPETEPEQPEAEPEQPETDPEQPETETEQSESEPEQLEVEPEQQETEPEQLETETEQSETEPEQTEAELETESEQTEAEMEQPETEMEQSEAEPEQTETEPEQTETEPEQPEAEPEQPEPEPEQPEAEPEQPDTEPEQPEPEPEQPEPEPEPSADVDIPDE